MVILPPYPWDLQRRDDRGNYYSEHLAPHCNIKRGPYGMHYICELRIEYVPHVLHSSGIMAVFFKYEFSLNSALSISISSSAVLSLFAKKKLNPGRVIFVALLLPCLITVNVRCRAALVIALEIDISSPVVVYGVTLRGNVQLYCSWTYFSYWTTAAAARE